MWCVTQASFTAATGLTVRCVQPLEGRNKIRNALTAESVQPPLRLSFLELQANHAFIRYSGAHSGRQRGRLLDLH